MTSSSCPGRKVDLNAGVAKGIGLEFAWADISKAATFVIGDINSTEARNASNGVGKGAYVDMDVTAQQKTERAKQHVEEKYGQIDLLANNDGLFDLAGIVANARDYVNCMFDLNVARATFEMHYLVKKDEWA